MRSRTRRTAPALALVAALAAAILPLAIASPAHAASDDGGSTVSWGTRPADTEHGEGRPNFVYDLVPGDVVDDALNVANRGEQAIDLTVYAADGITTDDGALDILPFDEESTELGSWIDVEQESISLDPGESALVPFTLTVPDDAQPGDYAAGVVASMRVEGDSGIVTERRLGSRVLLRVAGELAPSVAISSFGVDFAGGLNPFAPGSATVDLTISNPGNATLQVAGDIALAGPFGWGAATVDVGEIPELLPGADIVRTVDIAEVWPLVLLGADAQVAGDVVVRDGAVPPPTATVEDAASAQAWAVPWVIFGLIVVIAALIAWRVLAARSRARAHARAVDEAVERALAEQRDEPVGAH